MYVNGIIKHFINATWNDKQVVNSQSKSGNCHLKIKTALW